MRVLAIGDVCGQPGVDFLVGRLSGLRRDIKADLVVVNGENTCIRGLSPAHADQIFAAGADVITLGNHAFDNRQILSYLDDCPMLIRPSNMPAMRPGNGFCLLDVLGKRVCVINLIGQVDMDYHAASPFTAVDGILKSVDADLFIVDFHASATSEKYAMAYHLDGRAAVMWGTHTHVQTADAKVFKGGLGYITDLGMTGGLDSVIGIRPEQSLAGFLGHLTSRYESAEGDPAIQGAIFDLKPDFTCAAARGFTLRQGTDISEI